MRVFRSLSREEFGLARALLKDLDQRDRFHHFFQAMTEADFDVWQERAAGHVLLGCLEHGGLVGLSEMAVDRDRVECSICVRADRRGRGIGTELFERTCRHARSLGAGSLTMLVARNEVAMFNLAVRHHGLSVYRHGRSMILPGSDHATDCWLAFDLDRVEARPWYAGAARWVRDALEL